MTLDPTVRSKVEQWLKPPFDPETIAEIQALVDANDEKELHDRFYADLEFGTGGLRGLMGAGLNRMNRYTVGRATQGLAVYILKQGMQDPSVVIAHDSRLRSEEFVRESACVLAHNGIRAYLFESLRPTPELSFAVRELRATAGIVVTASHNPKEYNGYKVYWSDGGQIVPPHDTGIIAEVKAIDDPARVARADYDEALRAGRIRIVGKEMDEAYLAAILPLSVNPALCHAQGKRLKLAYTPLHGTGGQIVPEALRRWGFEHVIECQAQSTPDGTFPNAPSPNPEEAVALQAAIETARREGADLVLATDPDADRVGIAIRDGEEYRLITGNQVASLLVDYVLGGRTQAGTLPANAAVVKTIVTTELIARIAAHYGVRIDNVLTGFKYIGEKIRLFEETGEAQFVVGGEESYGYLVGTHARDKDAIVSCCFIAEIAADSLSRGESLLDRLDSLYTRYGVFLESLQSLVFAGAEGIDKIARIMRTFRETPPRDFLGSPVVEIRDYKRDEVRDMRAGKVVGPTGLPQSNVLVFRTEDGSQIVARPSGTEPKIKFYFMCCDVKELPIANRDELARRKAALQSRVDSLREEFVNQARSIASSDQAS
ncbi:phospho-sugar mutase [Candidatus Sumerlaeota bacterium]|nr:phospho-sugar mutase [Candidatus Sumerlaeota bacterium]